MNPQYEILAKCLLPEHMLEWFDLTNVEVKPKEKKSNLKHQREEGVLGAAVKTISDKVDTINQHIDGVLEDAPTKLKVSVNVADADWQKIQDQFDLEHKWMLGKMQEHIRQVYAMFVEERRRVQKRYKEYDGCYLGHYAQWFFWFFFVLGFFVFTSAIVMMVGKWCNWF